MTHGQRVGWRPSSVHIGRYEEYCVSQRNPRHTSQSRGRRGTWVGRHMSLVVCAALLIAIGSAIAIVKVTGLSPSKTARLATGDPRPLRYVGVYEPGAPGSYSGIQEFARAVGRQPNLVSYYSGWGEKFQVEFAEAAAKYGATAIVQMDPTNISIASIADGKYDSYLTSFADEVVAFGRPVVICFGHEMNGFWETWGYHHTPPATFVAAWRHIVTIFHHQGADNAKWLWQVNSLSSQTGPVRDWWPGAAYVTWVGVSGYYYLPGDNFDNVFNPVVTAVRQFTQDPVLIAETAVGPQAGQSRGIKDLFAGIRAQGDLGLVWFDQHSYGGLYKGEDWRLEGNAVALAAFRRGLSG
jgi:mannan endo-1,4-beta-mannosidase